VWEIKVGSLEDEARDAALLQMLASAAPADEVARAQARLIASAPHHTQLSNTAQRMLATAYAVTAVLRSATGLDWSVAIIGLCKAMEIEIIHRIAEPLRLAASDQDLTADLKDDEFVRVARYCAGTASPPELGSLARFLRTAAIRRSSETSGLVTALRAVTKAWPSADWLFTKGGFTDTVEHLTREYRNPAAHTALLSEEDFTDCARLVPARTACYGGSSWRHRGPAEPAPARGNATFAVRPGRPTQPGDDGVGQLLNGAPVCIDPQAYHGAFQSIESRRSMPSGTFAAVQTLSAAGGSHLDQTQVTRSQRADGDRINARRDHGPPAHSGGESGVSPAASAGGQPARDLLGLVAAVYGTCRDRARYSPQRCI